MEAAAAAPEGRLVPPAGMLVSLRSHGCEDHASAPLRGGDGGAADASEEEEEGDGGKVEVQEQSGQDEEEEDEEEEEEEEEEEPRLKYHRLVRPRKRAMGAPSRIPKRATEACRLAQRPPAAKSGLPTCLSAGPWSRGWAC